MMIQLSGKYNKYFRGIVNKNNSYLNTFIFLVVDAFAIFICFQAAIWLREFIGFAFNKPIDLSNLLQQSNAAIIFCLSVFIIFGFYPGYGLTAVRELEQTSKMVTLVFFLLTGISYLSKFYQDFSRFVLIVAWLLTLVILPLMHFFIRNVLSRTSFYGTPVVIYGNPPLAEAIEYSLLNSRRLGWIPHRIFPLSAATSDKLIANYENIAILATEEQEVVKSYTRALSRNYRKVVLIQQNDHFGTHWITPHDLGGLLGLEFEYHLLDPVAVFVKRVIDIIFGIFLFVLASPLLLIFAIWIKLDSPGPVLFRQERLGYLQKPITFLKLRTMIQNAPELLEQKLAENPELKGEYDKYHKLKNDPRITHAGRFLRRFSLDELPQLINVINGEMSLSGPRPYLVNELDEMGNSAQIILRVKPGITGWWQVMGRNTATFQQRLEMDEYYISNWSVWMDAYLFMKTVAIIPKGKGY